MSTTFEAVANKLINNNPRSLAFLEKAIATINVEEFNVPDFVAIDFETANKYRNSACALSAIIVCNNQITDKKFWYIKPNTDDFYFSYLHGIKAETVKNSMNIAELWNSELKELLSGKIIVAHNAPFDISVLRASLAEYDIKIPRYQAIDKVLLARKYFPLLDNYKLPTVCKFLDIKLDHHNALSDAEACANIVIHLNNHEPIEVLKKKIIKQLFRAEVGEQLFKIIHKRIEFASYSSEEDTYKDFCLLQRVLGSDDKEVNNKYAAKVFRLMGDVYAKINDIKGNILFYSLAYSLDERYGVKRRLNQLINDYPDDYEEILTMLERDAFPEKYLIYEKPSKEIIDLYWHENSNDLLGCCAFFYRYNIIFCFNYIYYIFLTKKSVQCYQH